MFALRLLLVGATAANATAKTATKAQVRAIFQNNCYNKAQADCPGSDAEKCAAWDATKKCITTITTDALTTDATFQGLVTGLCTPLTTKAACEAKNACANTMKIPKAELEKTAGTSDLTKVKDDKGTMFPMDNTEPRDKIDKKEICSAKVGQLCSPCKWDDTTKCTQNVKIGTEATMTKFTPDICKAAKASNGVRSATMFGAAVASMFALIMV